MVEELLVEELFGIQISESSQFESNSRYIMAKSENPIVSIFVVAVIPNHTCSSPNHYTLILHHAFFSSSKWSDPSGETPFAALVRPIRSAIASILRKSSSPECELNTISISSKDFPRVLEFHHRIQHNDETDKIGRETYSGSRKRTQKIPSVSVQMNTM